MNEPKPGMLISLPLKNNVEVFGLIIKVGSKFCSTFYVDPSGTSSSKRYVIQNKILTKAKEISITDRDLRNLPYELLEVWVFNRLAFYISSLDLLGKFWEIFIKSPKRVEELVSYLRQEECKKARKKYAHYKKVGLLKPQVEEAKPAANPENAPPKPLEYSPVWVDAGISPGTSTSSFFVTYSSSDTTGYWK